MNDQEVIDAAWIDRGFRVGDVLRVRRWDPNDPTRLFNEESCIIITHIMGSLPFAAVRVHRY